MKFCLSALKQVQPVMNFQGAGLTIDMPFFHQKDKVVFVMGATGTGKSRLAIDLATRFPAEIINSDKIQVYKGLDIVTNKVTQEECHGVPHHLLGVIHPNSTFSLADFHHFVPPAVDSIIGRDRLPIIAGGSNSYIKSLVNESPEFHLRYQCCFLWIDVSMPVLHSFVSKRVDKMVGTGLIDEVRGVFDPSSRDYSRGIRRAIGVPELDRYFREESSVSGKGRARFLEKAIATIKENTCMLACRQLQKINRLYKQWKPEFHRIDATQVFLKEGYEADEAWEKLVANPAAIIVDQFLYDDQVSITVPVDGSGGGGGGVAIATSPFAMIR